MGNCIIAYPNRADNAVLGGGSWEAELPITNLQTRIIKQFARTTGADDGSFVVEGTFSTSREMRLFALVRHNFSVEATYRLRVYADDSFSVLEHDSGVLPVFDVIYTEQSETWDSGNFWDLTISAEDRAGLTASVIYVLPDNFTERAFRLEVFDADNDAGYLQAGRLFVGSGWTPVYNLAYGNTLAFEPRSIVDETIGGQEFFDERESPRVARFGIPFTSEDEAMGVVFELQRKQGITKDVFFIKDPDDKPNILRNSFLGRMRELPPIEQDFFANFANQFEIKELI